MKYCCCTISEKLRGFLLITSGVGIALGYFAFFRSNRKSEKEENIKKKEDAENDKTKKIITIKEKYYLTEKEEVYSAKADNEDIKKEEEKNSRSIENEELKNGGLKNGGLEKGGLEKGGLENGGLVIGGLEGSCPESMLSFRGGLGNIDVVTAPHNHQVSFNIEK